MAWSFPIQPSRNHSGCGNAPKLYLKVSDKVIIKKIPAWRLLAVPEPSHSAVFANMIKGMRIEADLKLTNKDIAKALDDLHRQKCPVMQQEALEVAIRH